MYSPIYSKVYKIDNNLFVIFKKVFEIMCEICARFFLMEHYETILS